MKTPLLFIISVSVAVYFIEEKYSGRYTNITKKAITATAIVMERTRNFAGIKYLTIPRRMITEKIMIILSVVRQPLSG